MRMISIAVAFVVWLVFAPSSAHAQADFYKGKTINVVVGARAVGSLSVSAQILTRHWGRYIPGNPTVILRQMPGGGCLFRCGHGRAASPGR